MRFFPILFCFWPCLFYSEYNNTNFPLTMFVVGFKPGVVIAEIISSNDSIPSMKWVHMNCGGKFV